MAIKKIQIKPKASDGSYPDTLHPETSADQVKIDDTSSNFSSTNVEGALSELFTSVSNGKQQVATAITGKGGTVADADGDGVSTFGELANGVSGIPTGGVESVQRGIFDSPGSMAYGEYLIPVSTVDLSKALLIVERRGQDWGQRDQDKNTMIGYMKDNSTIALYKPNSEYSFDMARVKWALVEFKGVKSIQRGRYFNPDNTSEELIIPINSVDVNKSFAVTCSCSRDDISYPSASLGSAILSSSTQLQLLFSEGSQSRAEIAWQVIEFE